VCPLATERVALPRDLCAVAKCVSTLIDDVITISWQIRESECEKMSEKRDRQTDRSGKLTK